MTCTISVSPCSVQNTKWNSSNSSYNFTRHCASSATHEGDTEKTLAIMEAVANKQLPWLRAALGHLAGLKRVRTLNCLATSLLAHIIWNRQHDNQSVRITQNQPWSRWGCPTFWCLHRTPWSVPRWCLLCTTTYPKPGLRCLPNPLMSEPTLSPDFVCPARWWCISTVNTLFVDKFDAVWAGKKITSSQGSARPRSTRPAGTPQTAWIL